MKRARLSWTWLSQQTLSTKCILLLPMPINVNTILKCWFALWFADIYNHFASDLCPKSICDGFWNFQALLLVGVGYTVHEICWCPKTTILDVFEQILFLNIRKRDALCVANICKLVINISVESCIRDCLIKSFLAVSLAVMQSVMKMLSSLFFGNLIVRVSPRARPWSVTKSCHFFPFKKVTLGVTWTFFFDEKLELAQCT